MNWADLSSLPIQSPTEVNPVTGVAGLLGFKLLLFYEDRFVSPSKTSFVWSRSRLAHAKCEMPELDLQTYVPRGIHIPPGENCTCGIYAARDWSMIVDDYLYSKSKCCFLVESIGACEFYEDVPTWRAEGVAVLASVDTKNLAGVDEHLSHLFVGRDYFGVDIFNLEDCITLVNAQYQYHVERKEVTNE